MMRIVNEDDLNLLASRIIDTEEYFVVATEKKGKSKYVVYVDGKGGVNVEKCTHWNHALRECMEQQDIAAWGKGEFELEVSSFGVGRPLQDERQWGLNIGRIVEVSVAQQHPQPTLTMVGKLVEVGEEHLTLEIKTKAKQASPQPQKILKKDITHIHVEVIF